MAEWVDAADMKEPRWADCRFASASRARPLAGGWQRRGVALALDHALVEETARGLSVRDAIGRPRRHACRGGAASGAKGTHHQAG